MIGNSISTINEEMYRILDKILIDNNTYYLCVNKTNNEIEAINPLDIVIIL